MKKTTLKKFIAIRLNETVLKKEPPRLVRANSAFEKPIVPRKKKLVMPVA